MAAASDANGKTTQYRYDDAGNLVAITYVDGSVESFGYEDEHRGVTVRRPAGDETSQMTDAIFNRVDDFLDEAVWSPTIDIRGE